MFIVNDPPVYDRAGQLVRMIRSDDEWRRILLPEQHRIARQGGTESPGRSAFHRFDQQGVFSCIACGLPLYSSPAKFEHCAGWPSFTSPVDARHVVAKTGTDGSLNGAEVVCGRCDSHLGHLFLDGPEPARTRHWINSAALRFAGPVEIPDAVELPLRLEIAVFGMGWFWGPDARFGRHEGVLRTRAGYAGGLSGHPSYRAIADHTETVEIVFDPSKIGYAQLLAEFWKSHDAASGRGPRQYRSVILFASESQRIAADASRAAESARLGRLIRTAIEPLQCFWPAEEYHQKYYLQADKALAAEFKAVWPGKGRWYLTSSAARFNAFASGVMDASALSRELERLALPDGLKARMTEALR